MPNMLLPLDGSELAECAIPHAEAVAKAFESTVTLLRVITPTEFRSKDAFSRVDWRLHQHQARTYLQSVARLFESSGVSCEVCVKEGRPAEAVIETAREQDTQLLVMSTHGRGEAVDFPRGGVAGKILSTFSGSVLLVAPKSARRQRQTVRYRSIFVPVDGSHQTECALRIATRMAATLGARLTLACITEETTLPHIIRHDRRAASLGQELADLARAAAERHLSVLKAQIPDNIPLRTSLLMSRQPADAVADALQRADADLLVTSKDFLNRATTMPGSRPLGDSVPVLALSAESVANAFRSPENTEGSEITEADAS